VILMAAMKLQAANVLCIGLNEYENYKSLDCPEQNVAKMAELLTANGHQVTTLTGKSATRQAVLDALNSRPSMIYFAGHGEKGSIVLSDGTLSLKELGNGCSFLVLDCCFSGSVLAESGQTKVLAAAEREAFEKQGYGLFTKHLMRWVKAGRDLADDRLASFLHNAVRKESGGWQKPVLGYI
jgi:uncharacterized caspase-like protein